MGLDVVHQTVLVGEGHGVRAAVDAELREDPLDVAADSLRANHEGAGDFGLI